MRELAKVIARLFSSLLALLLALGLTAGFYFGAKGYQMYREAMAEEPLAVRMEAIRSMDGYTEMEELPQIYVDAVISAEDKRFFDHHGIDYLAIGRALWNDLRAASFVEGGSTISQQLVKNTCFTQEKRLERKFAELFAARELEKEYSKEEIFELYVNSIYFGSGYYGIRAAAEGYFGKTPSELTEYEAVLLAGLPNAPSAYSPDTNPELARQRARQVLERMVECKVLSQEEAWHIFADRGK